MPEMTEVSEAEFDAFVKEYPRELTRNVSGMYDPPVISFNDFTIADAWPESVVAYHSASRGPNEPPSNWHVASEFNNHSGEPKTDAD